MIIWGTTGRNSTIDSGLFHCPRCGRDKPFELVSVRRYFTLYFIPLIPMGEAGRYIECKNCSGTFDEQARHLDPEVENAKFREAFSKALLHSAIVMAQADGPVNSRELDSIADILTNISGSAYEIEDVRSAAQSSHGTTLAYALQGVNEGLSDDGRGMLVHSLYDVAIADGRLLDEEQAVLFEAGKLLGFRKKAIQKFLASTEN